jgi:hypothetical protein
MVRAKVWAGREFMPGRRTWYYEVRDSAGNVMLRDNTGDWRKIYEEARDSATVIRRMELAEHKLKTPKWMR